MWRWVRKIGEWILFFLLMVFWPVVPFAQYRTTKKEGDGDPRLFATYAFAGGLNLAVVVGLIWLLFIFWKTQAPLGAWLLSTLVIFLIVYFGGEISFWRYFRHWEKKVAS